MSLSVRLLDKSPRYIWPWFAARKPLADLMTSLDIEGFERLKKFRNEGEYPEYRKYFNAPYWLRKNMQRALFLGLDRAPQPLRILDLGAGFGYFGHVAGFFGHKVTGLDIPGDLLFNEARRFLGVECRHCMIRAGEPLPRFGETFDLITAFQICFDDHYEDMPWQAQPWDFLLADLRDHHLGPGGRVYLEFNYHRKLGDWLSSEVRDLFTNKYGAAFNGRSRVTIRKPEAHARAA